jgi:hypothetical protein
LPLRQSLFDFQEFEKFSGDFVGRVTPVPIPNTEVKPAGADGTARETAWESRKSPGLFKESPREHLVLAGFCSIWQTKPQISQIDKIHESDETAQ